MPLTSEQIQQARSGAGFSATPNTPAPISLSERLGLTVPAQPKVIPQTFAESPTGKYTTDILNQGAKPLQEASRKVVEDVNAFKENPTLGNLASKGFDVAGDLAGGAVGTVGGVINAGVVKPLSDFIGSIPIVQKLATSKGLSNWLDENASQDEVFAQKWQQFRNEHPELSKKLEGVRTIGELMALQAVVENPKVRSGVTDTIDTTFEGVKNKGQAVIDKSIDVANQGAEGIINKAGELKEQLTPEMLKTNPNKNLEKLVDETSGVADKKARISALEETGAENKGGTKQSLTGGVEIAPDKKAIARAKSVEGIVKSGASPVDNLTALNKEIVRISEKEVAPALKKAGKMIPISDKTPGWNTTVQRMVDIEKPDIIKADTTLDKTYDLVRQRMIDQIQKQEPTVEGLWEARKSFDQVVKEQFGDVAFDSEKNTAIKRAVSDMRREVNKIISERVPQYSTQMERLSNMYDARYNIAEQFQDIVNKGGLEKFKKLNPKTYQALKWGFILGGAGALKEAILP